MSSPIQFLRKLLDAGVDFDTAMLAAEKFEEEVSVSLAGRRASDAERQRRHRAKSGHVMSRDMRDKRDSVTPEQKVSPTPPSKTQTLSPLNPPKPSEPAAVADATESVFEEAWTLATPQMRKRSKGKDQTRQLWGREARKAGSEATLLASLRRYLREDPDVGRSGGPGFHLWLRDGKWEHYLPRPEPPGKPAAPVDGAVIAARVQHFRDTGEWKPTWGDRPTDLAA